MNRTRAGLVVAGVAALAVLAQPASATATPASSTVLRIASQESNGQAFAPGYVLYDTYLGLSRCVAEGNWGMQQGYWLDYKCEYLGSGFYGLYVILR